MGGSDPGHLNAGTAHRRAGTAALSVHGAGAVSFAGAVLPATAAAAGAGTAALAGTVAPSAAPWAWLQPFQADAWVVAQTAAESAAVWAVDRVCDVPHTMPAQLALEVVAGIGFERAVRTRIRRRRDASR